MRLSYCIHCSRSHQQVHRMHGLLCDLPVFLLSVMSFENRIFLIFSSHDRSWWKKTIVMATFSCSTISQKFYQTHHRHSLFIVPITTSWKYSLLESVLCQNIFTFFQPLSPFWIHLPQNKVIKNVSLDLSLFFFVFLGVKFALFLFKCNAMSFFVSELFPTILVGNLTDHSESAAALIPGHPFCC